MTRPEPGSLDAAEAGALLALERILARGDAGALVLLVAMHAN